MSARLNGIPKALKSRPTCRHPLELNEELSKEMYLISEQEEAYWITRARTNWIKCGDQNTGYFHKSVIVRIRRNKITSLNSEVGETIEGEELVPHIVTYFSNLFSSVPTIPLCDNHHYLNTIRIDQPNTIEEVGRVVFDLDPLKALLEGQNPIQRRKTSVHQIHPPCNSKLLHASSFSS